MRGDTYLKIVELVVDVEAELLDPVPRSFELIGQSHDEERVERVDDKVPHSPCRTHVGSVVRDGVVVVEPERVTLVRVIGVL